MVTTYTVLKSLHVLAVAIWLGGGSVSIVYAARARRQTDPDKLAELVRQLAWVGPRFFTTSSLVLVATGFGMIANGDLPYSTWVVLGLIGWAATFVTGSFFLGPTSSKAVALIDERGASDPGARALMNRMLTVAHIDIVVLTLVLIDMVIKPT